MKYIILGCFVCTFLPPTFSQRSWPLKTAGGAVFRSLSEPANRSGCYPQETPDGLHQRSTVTLVCVLCLHRAVFRSVQMWYLILDDFMWVEIGSQRQSDWIINCSPFINHAEANMYMCGYVCLFVEPVSRSKDNVRSWIKTGSVVCLCNTPVSPSVRWM